MPFKLQEAIPEFPSDTITNGLSPEPTAELLAVIAAFLILFLLFIIIHYIITSWAMMVIARKTNTQNSWLAWIPVGNLYLYTQIAKMPAWTIGIPIASGISYFISNIVSVFSELAGSILTIVFFPLAVASLVWSVMAYWKICEARNRPGWWGILFLIPVVGWIFLYLTAKD